MIDSIMARRSVRTYDERLFSVEMRNEVEQLLQEAPQGPFGDSMRFALIEREQARREEKVKLGTYGYIKGAPYFVAAAVCHSETAELEFGFVFEHLILRMTGLGLATCWLGGSIKRKEYAQLLDLGPDDFVPCVSALGYAAAAPTLRERFTRWSIKADRRRPFDSLFFSDTFKTPVMRETAGPLAELLDMVRLAPSAHNRQPCRVVWRGNQFHFFLERWALIGRMITAADLQLVDIGIAMCHFQLAAGKQPVAWAREMPDMEIPSGVEYVATATLG